MSKTDIHINPDKRMANNVKYTIQRFLKRTGWIWATHPHILRRELKHRKIIRRNSKTPHINLPLLSSVYLASRESILNNSRRKQTAILTTLNRYTITQSGKKQLIHNRSNIKIVDLHIIVIHIIHYIKPDKFCINHFIFSFPLVDTYIITQIKQRHTEQHKTERNLRA
nr:MAG TPA: hypothetical protein [Caudoviricetes sp.]